MGIWVVSKGDAIYIGVYDPKAVDTIEMTVRSGWWAELGLSPLTSMTAPDLDGLAGYIIQGISLDIPEPDHKGRVDMSKAALVFTPGPPPPPIRLRLSRPDPLGLLDDKRDRAWSPYQSGSAMTTENFRVVWKGMRRFGRRALLLACFRNVSAVIGYDNGVGHCVS